MKAVILDAASLGPDVDLTAIREQVDTLEVHQTSTTAQSRERLAGAEIAIVNKVVLDGATLEALPELRLICVLATGTNNIDMATAERLGVPVRNVTAYGTASVAQHTLMMILALANRLPLYQRDVATGRWNQSPFFCLMDHGTLQLEGKHLVIVGQGELGRRVAALAEAFGMRVSFAARPGNEAGDSRPGIAELAPEADVISLHCPLTEATRHLIGADLLASLKPGALLVNCARGGIIDEEAALEALRGGRLGGLGVDVLPVEPPRDGHPLLDALGEPLNLIVTPHNAWITPEARQRIVALTGDNLRRWKAQRDGA
ncbi:D-2-hydroxyacid dehydrogenase [Halomonas sp. MCCC 1A17488]|uniref:D-2-hydroxyacid dehydrogenase n=1 Tax=Billgrantia sulfidoxydans TaxID=2733484 RepID=A0ABX7W4M2_9GAMM|nr:MULTISPECIES: D-2-hydroxyacid dehydrogenase [Halomonas]MCE8015100.1 D-2-hydroxyacid dehydrogenase [Halomonas sp. MCCC 1A17488]MCG3238433.1 D-2-hydroxyacid dehydrogenase [Halomonas sp. MCCC 1A17488]QPP47825.1 D-2-hydroxyacid dehydrogenase [Halomonas sp. SS10-MC5]QTP55130.1 D-2-hydroxyacid dehydrogenase [Halomonas sulfidoxydans]